MKKSINGFTIVELLIVIVVIAILASISIVSYNGVQSRAEQSANFATIRAYTQAFQLMKADTGNLPTVTACLGPAGSYANNVCNVLGQAGTVDAATNASLAQYGPAATAQPGVKSKGAQATLVFSPAFYSEPALLWQIPDSQDCVASPGRFVLNGAWVDGRTYSSRGSGLTFCMMSLKNL